MRGAAFLFFFFFFLWLERGVSRAVPISKRLVSVSLLLVSCYENFTVPPIIVYCSRPTIDGSSLSLPLFP